MTPAKQPFSMRSPWNSWSAHARKRRGLYHECARRAGRRCGRAKITSTHCLDPIYMTDAAHPRSIRSFVTRAGRITEAQERALAELWPAYGVEFSPRTLELAALFGRSAPRCCEIGFGNGDNLLALAAAHPERDFLGIEVHRPGVGRLLLALERQGLRNVRLICHDAVEVLGEQLPPGSLDEILIL